MVALAFDDGGNLATTRCQYDFIHCDRPGCWDETLRRVGFVRRTPLLDFAPELLDALKVASKFLTVPFPPPAWFDLKTRIDAVIAKAEAKNG